MLKNRVNACIPLGMVRLKNVYRMLMIGFGAGLITLGFIGVALSDRIEIQKRQSWVLVGQRAGASVASFSLNLSSGVHMLGVSVWVHNYAEAFYSISDVNGNHVVILRLTNTDQSSEWKYSEGYFQITDSGYYTFKLFNATFSSIRSTAKLFLEKYVDECSYPYRSFLWVGIVSLVIGVPLVVIGLASPLTPKP
jgi:hypothetical protein